MATQGPWIAYAEFNGEYEIAGPMGRREGIKYGPKSRPTVATAYNEDDATMIECAPCLWDALNAMVLKASELGPDVWDTSIMSDEGMLLKKAREVLNKAKNHA